MPSVKIGPNFFRNELKAYSDWKWAYAREILQNSIDCRSDSILVTVTPQGGDVLIVVENNGEPMTEEILVDKLLALGESGKNFAGTVGGYGQAKIILYFSQKSYTIYSGNNKVTGCGGDFELTKLQVPVCGTRSEVLITPQGSDTAEQLAKTLSDQFKRVIVMTQRPNISFSVNGDCIPGSLKKGSRRRSFSWCTIYTNKTFQNRLIVRINGMPMFTKYVDVNRTIVVELEGDSSKYLTSNRDSLQYKYADQLDDFMYDLAVNKRSALEEPTVSYTHYKGERFDIGNKAETTMSEVLSAAYATIQTADDIANAEEEGPTLAYDTRPTLEAVRPEASAEEFGAVLLRQSLGNTKPPKLPKISHEFVIKNELGMAVPEHMLPESFSAYSLKLVKSWAACQLEIHRLFGCTDDFAVGFIFGETTEAEFERGSYGDVFYISPSVVKRNSFGGRSLARRWNFTPDGKMAILSTAVHEFAHRRCKGHDEDFASHYTELMGPVLKNVSRFHKCFR